MAQFSLDLHELNAHALQSLRHSLLGALKMQDRKMTDNETDEIMRELSSADSEVNVP